MAGPMPENFIILDLSSSYGALSVGTWLASAMWGISSLQCSAEADSALLRYLITFLWLFDTGNTILCMKGNWKVLIAEYGKIANLFDVQKFAVSHRSIQAVVIFVVQMYFIRRIYTFARQTFIRSNGAKLGGYFFVVFMSVLAGWQIIGLIVYQVFGYGKPLATLSTTREIDLNLSLRGAAVATDVIVALGMLFLLTRGSKNQFSQTRRMLQRLVVVTVSSGTATAIFATIVLILIAKYPNDLYYTIFEYSLCSLYFSTLLANLNTRDFVQGRGKNGSVLTTSGFQAANNNTNTLVLQSTNHGGVRVQEDFESKMYP
ncbi:hypothetical protein R3P38DRAFT_3004074 [Favolaschia claudopus]|uniref:DUF6534 domain-containing protein n=1 Tax=Favolaschia claudopus TaxID=2862362 RepID=A0AAW0AMP2_9AGAR